MIKNDKHFNSAPNNLKFSDVGRFSVKFSHDGPNLGKKSNQVYKF